LDDTREMKINLHIDVMMAKRKISAGELANRIGITPANLSILKNDRAKAIRFSTLAALCRELDCQPGDLLEYVRSGDADVDGTDGTGTDGTDDSATDTTRDDDHIT
jgi:putative transcriptional regulator